MLSFSLFLSLTVFFSFLKVYFSRSPKNKEKESCGNTCGKTNVLLFDTKSVLRCCNLAWTQTNTKFHFGFCLVCSEFPQVLLRIVIGLFQSTIGTKPGHLWSYNWVYLVFYHFLSRSGVLISNSLWQQHTVNNITLCISQSFELSRLPWCSAYRHLRSTTVGLS